MLKKISSTSRGAKSFKLLNLIFSFGVFKSLAFFAPLLLVNQLTIQDYASFESGLAFANVLVIILNLGVSAAIPLFILKENNLSDVAYVYFHTYFVSLVLLLSIFISFMVGMHDEMIFVLITLSILCNQRTISTHKKTISFPLQASFYEIYVFFSLTVCVVYGYVAGELTLGLINLFLVVFSIILLGVSLANFKKIKFQPKFFNFGKFKYLYSFSSASLLVGTCILLIVTFIRVCGESFLTAEQFIAYSISFRLCAISILAFQFIMIIKFKNIYESSSTYLDNHILIIFFLVMTVALLIGQMYPFFIDFIFEPRVVIIINNYKEIMLPIILTMPLWAMSAILENIISRERAFKRMLLILFLLLIPFCLIVFLSYGRLNYLNIIYLHVALVFLLILSQLITLKNNGVKLRRTYMCVFGYALIGGLSASLSS